MDTELDDLIEVAACIEAARLALMPIIARAEQREQARLRQARKRANAPTTHTKTDASLTRSA